MHSTQRGVSCWREAKSRHWRRGLGRASTAAAVSGPTKLQAFGCVGLLIGKFEGIRSRYEHRILLFLRGQVTWQSAGLRRGWLLDGEGEDDAGAACGKASGR